MATSPESDEILDVVAHNPQAEVIAAVGVGPFFAVPTGGSSSAPVLLGVPPAGETSFGLYLAPSQSVAYTFATSAAAAASAFAAGLYSTASNTASTGGDIIVRDSFVAPLSAYVGTVSGAARARFF